MIVKIGGIVLLLSIMGVTAEGGQGGIVSLGQPCRSKNVLSGCVVVDRTDGRERFAVANMNEATGAEIIYIDFEKDKAKVYSSGTGQGSWGLMEIPGDRLLMPTYHAGWYVVFDLKKKEYIKSVPFEGEGYIWTAALGGDGRAYGGTYPGGKLGALDLKTYAIEDMGSPAPPNMYLRSVYALPDGRILCNFGQEKPVVLIFDPATKKFDPLPESMAGVGSGVTWQGYFLAGNRVFDGKTLQPVAPPFPAPPSDKGGWQVDGALTKGDTVYIRQGTAIHRWSKGDKDLTLVADMDLRGGSLYAAAKDGRLLGIRGQDYFVIKPGDKSLNLKAIPAECGPRPTHFLRADADGVLWGGPGFGQTLFFLDPKTKKHANTRTISNSGGEPYDAAFFDGVVYAAAYAGGEVIRYDPREPWDQMGGKNPRTVANLGEKGYIRPIGTIQLGPDGKLYSGWQARYGTYGGAVAITDPKTEKTELIENPLGEQAVAGIAVGDGMIFVGTNLAANGLPEKKGEWPKFGIIDIATKKTVFEHTFEGTNSVRPLAYDPVSKRCVVSSGKLWLFDTSTKQFTESTQPGVNSGCVSLLGGKLYYGSNNSVVALDVRTDKSEIIAEAPDRVRNVAVDSKGNIYFSCGLDIYAVSRE